MATRTRKPVRTRTMCLLLTCLILLIPAPAMAGGSEFNLLLRSETRELELWYRANRILVYAFGTNQFKPYVRELYTLDGMNMLRDAPADHLHHHGLMYAIQVNGINFWEEIKTSGYQIPDAELTREVKRDSAGSSQARFSQNISWVTHEAAHAPDPDAFALLTETRTITVTVNPGSEEIAVQWRSDFAVGPAATSVTLTGTPYHGLGMRLPAEFDQVAVRQNAAGLPFSEEGRDEVTIADWVAASQTMAGREYTVAVFHHPSNAGEHSVFSMVNPFAYLSATQGLDKRPLEYERGDTFTVRHLVTVIPGRLTAEALERRYQRWIE
jgi:hypothetical protein